MPAGNRRLAQWRVTWLIEHSTSHQLLWCIDSFVLQNPPLRQAPNRYMQYSPCGYKIKICQNRTELKINKPHKTKTLHRKIFSFFSAPFLPTHICTFAKSLC